MNSATSLQMKVKHIFLFVMLTHISLLVKKCADEQSAITISDNSNIGKVNVQIRFNNVDINANSETDVEDVVIIITDNEYESDNLENGKSNIKKKKKTSLSNVFGKVNQKSTLDVVARVSGLFYQKNIKGNIV
jgi:hypothetical protein